MRITHTLYSDELIPFAAAGADVHAWTRDTYAPALEAAYLAEWPDATVEIEVVPNTTGAGPASE